MPGKPITSADADVMIKEYISYMTNLGVDMNHQTQSVIFTGTTVMNWLNGIMPQADELRVFMGLYPPGHSQAGHTTVILWPYKDGQPIGSMSAMRGDGGGGGGNDDPDGAFNDGQGNP